MNFWTQFAPAECLPHHCNCEMIRDAFIRQPSATWSSLAYILLAFWFYRSKQVKTFEIKAWTMVFLLMGSVSFFGHLSFTRFSLALDFGGIIMVLSFFALLNLFELLGLSKRTMLGHFTLYFVLVAAAMYTMDKYTKIGIALAVFLLAVGDLIRDMGWKFLRERTLQLALLVVTLSFGFFVLDEMHLACEPENIMQFHSLWHIGTAYGIYLYGKWRFSSVA